MACHFLLFVGKKCRSWDGCCIAKSSGVTIVLDVASTNMGRRNTKMPYGIDWEWLIGLIAGNGGKEDE